MFGACPKQLSHGDMSPVIIIPGTTADLCATTAFAPPAEWVRQYYRPGNCQISLDRNNYPGILQPLITYNHHFRACMRSLKNEV